MEQAQKPQRPSVAFPLQLAGMSVPKIYKLERLCTLVLLKALPFSAPPQGKWRSLKPLSAPAGRSSPLTHRDMLVMFSWLSRPLRELLTPWLLLQ